MTFMQLRKMAREKGLELWAAPKNQDRYPYEIWGREEFKNTKGHCFRAAARTLAVAEQTIIQWPVRLAS